MKVNILKRKIICHADFKKENVRLGGLTARYGQNMNQKSRRRFCSSPGEMRLSRTMMHVSLFSSFFVLFSSGGVNERICMLEIRKLEY